MQARRSMFERGNSAEEMPHLTKPLDSNVSGRRFESDDSATSAPLVEPQDVCLYRHKPVLPPDLAPSQGLGSRMGINKWETTEDLSGQVPMEQEVMPASEPSAVSDVTSPESPATQEVMSTENGQDHAESDAEVCTAEVRRSGGVGGSGGGSTKKNLWGLYWFYSRLPVGPI